MNSVISTYSVIIAKYWVRRQRRAPAIRKRINLHQDYEARYWSEKFNVSRDELESVVNKVGVMVGDVERELSRSLAL